MHVRCEHAFHWQEKVVAAQILCKKKSTSGVQLPVAFIFLNDSSTMIAQVNKPLVDEPRRTIPFPNSHIHRTNSELQLTEATLAAEARDLIMFERLIRGVEKKSVEFSQKLTSDTDRELLALNTRLTLEKLIKRKQELIFPSSIFQRNEEKTTSIKIRDSSLGQYWAVNEDERIDPIEEEVFNFDF
jgi:hypothetical protein